ncbi:homoserine O-succinyltransferase [Komagataeibacter sp. AV436]|uniref:Homoserine O-acetyltransferase n=1 Tax=Komagataeibacter melomenusus TaxID=2766578 RepID=A0ABX2AEI1_9PROT|nr:homoserine O-succinyltransferase [Komagataeibacter melomenusus]MBV1830014.1 homoserine O-succinyltransferase [Komagataeibacter melomenusus]NPC66724.1 homoserine O-succinyltransferase [Komagataeibacter melomenusus]
MPIRIPDDLPARGTLEAEGVMVMGETDAIRQDIRPLRIGLLNLMPNKIRTETQIARLIGATPLQVELTLVRMSGHVPRNASADHMTSFYRAWEDVRGARFDGFIITGAPVERLPFAEVTYWDELRRVFDWTRTNVHRCFNICWAAQAAVHHFHGMPKHALARKAFGVYDHRILAPASPYLQGFADDLSIPVSRWTEVRRADLPRHAGMTVLAESPETGLCLLDDPRHHALHMFNHLEYDSTSLADEYFRDRARGLDIAVPHNYFPHDDPALRPINRWRAHAHLLAGNWINQIYQTTPFDIARIGHESRHPELVCA